MNEPCQRCDREAITTREVWTGAGLTEWKLCEDHAVERDAIDRARQGRRGRIRDRLKRQRDA